MIDQMVNQEYVNPYARKRAGIKDETGNTFGSGFGLKKEIKPPELEVGRVKNEPEDLVNFKSAKPQDQNNPEMNESSDKKVSKKTSEEEESEEEGEDEQEELNLKVSPVVETPGKERKIGKKSPSSINL